MYACFVNLVAPSRTLLNKISYDTDTCVTLSTINQRIKIDKKSSVGLETG